VSDEARQSYARASQRGGPAPWLIKLLVIATLLVLAWFALTDGSGDGGGGSVRLVRDGRVVAEAGVDVLVQRSPRQLSRWLSRVPDTRRRNRRRAKIVFRTDHRALRRALMQALRSGGGRVVVPERPTSASMDLPVVKQAFRNNCETAALSMLLAARGVRVSQLRLQRELPRSAPLDPKPDPGGGLPTWGDPDRGFVGRVEGGGTSGGYGVYQAPVRRLARRYGVGLLDLTGAPESRVRDHLLSGRPVMVWVGLSEGPYKTWRSSEGRRIKGNLGEHTVVLTGIRGQELSVNDPLMGIRTTWKRDYFRELWERLGRRALSI
jgi:uncharacterized protein YvpB